MDQDTLNQAQQTIAELTTMVGDVNGQLVASDYDNLTYKLRAMDNTIGCGVSKPHRP